jgi:hypothetical protein
LGDSIPGGISGLCPRKSSRRLSKIRWQHGHLFFRYGLSPQLDTRQYPTGGTASFVYPESYDAEAGRYRGIRGGEVVNVTPDSGGLLVRPEVARKQLEEEANAAPGSAGPEPIRVPDGDAGPGAVRREDRGPAVVLGQGLSLARSRPAISRQRQHRPTACGSGRRSDSRGGHCPPVRPGGREAARHAGHWGRTYLQAGRTMW